MSVLWTAGKYPVLETELAAAAAATLPIITSLASAEAAQASPALNSVGPPTTDIIDAHLTAVRAAAALSAVAHAVSVLAPHAFRTAAAIAAAASADAMPSSAALWSAISYDATDIENGTASPVVTVASLWPNAQPAELSAFWQDLKRDLLAKQQHWQIWTDWYEDRLLGRAGNEKRELAYVQIENALWDRGPAAVNAEIRRRIEEIEKSELPPVEALPEQAPVATTFSVNAQGLIDVVPDPPSLDSSTDASQRELYDETREKAEVLVGFGHNQLGELAASVTRFRKSLPARIEEVSISLAWSRGNTLRCRLKAHDLSTASEEPDPDRLPPLVAEALRDLVHTWNIFVVGDPKGRAFDERRLGPSELDVAKRQIAAAAPIVEAVRRSQNVATPAAIDAIAEEGLAAANAPAGVDGDQAIDLSRKTTGNFVIQLLRFAYAAVRRESAFVWKEYRAGIYRAGGTATAAGIVYYSPQIVSFVARNAVALKEFAEVAWHNPAIGEIIDLIVKTLL